MPGPFSTKLTDYVGQGLAADRPVTPNVADDVLVLWYSTDTGEFSIWADGDWLGLARGPSATIEADEAIGAASFVNIHASGGARLQKANATDASKPCNAYAPAAIALGDTGIVFGAGTLITGLAGLTPGATYYLDVAGGAITDTPPAAAGNLIQELGVAVSATDLFFAPKEGTQL